MDGALHGVDIVLAGGRFETNRTPWFFGVLPSNEGGHEKVMIDSESTRQFHLPLSLRHPLRFLFPHTEFVTQG